MPSEKSDRRIAEIIRNCDSILAYTEGMSAMDYANDAKTQDAVERCLARISEAAVKLSGFAEANLATHDWIGIRRLGNVLRHEYDNVDHEVVWAIVSTQLPKLRDDLVAFQPGRDGKPVGLEPLDEG